MSPSSVSGGPYEIRGGWSLDVQRSGAANFSADQRFPEFMSRLSGRAADPLCYRRFLYTVIRPCPLPRLSLRILPNQLLGTFLPLTGPHAPRLSAPAARILSLSVSACAEFRQLLRKALHRLVITIGACDTELKVKIFHRRDTGLPAAGRICRTQLRPGVGGFRSVTVRRGVPPALSLNR
jgi:hypothetical protein